MANSYDMNEANIKRRRGLVDALTQQSLQPLQSGQMVGGIYVAPGLADALSKPLMALAANYAGGELDKEESANSQARQQDLASVIAGLQGKSGMDLTGSALGSQFPEVQQLGLKNFEYDMSPKNAEKFGKSFQTIVGPDGKPTNVLVGDRGTIQQSGTSPYQELKFVGGEAVNPQNAVEGQLYGREPKGTQVNITNPQETALQKQLGKNEGDMINAAREKRMAAQRTFNMATKLEKLDEGGVLSGPTAKPAIFIGRLASGLGVELTPESRQLLANSENFDQTIGTQISDMILNSSAGRGFTDTDREYVLNSFPSLMQSPEGRKNAFKFLKEASIRGAEEGRTIEAAVREGRMNDIDLTNGGMSQFQQSQQPAQQQTFNIQSEEEYNGLPSGSLYIGPDGKTRRKQ
jgi:hypothetical protein